MSSKIALLTISIVCSFILKNLDINRLQVADFHAKNIIEDTLPPLHTIAEKDINSVVTSFENQTITVNLKNGITHMYEHIDWDFEDHNSSINKKLRDAIRSIQMTFTKAEQAPGFPGGAEEWIKYLREFSIKHKEEIKGQEPLVYVVQFIVHLQGQVTDVVVIAGPRTELSKLAIQAIQDSAPWGPALQNGRKVVCYQKQVVKLSL